jgi:hypothetical protein
MSAFEKDVLIVVVSPRPGGAHLPEAVPITADCGHGAWIDPANEAGFEARGERYVTVCVPCVMRKGIPDASSEVTPETRARLHELGCTDEEIQALLDEVTRAATNPL